MDVGTFTPPHSPLWLYRPSRTLPLCPAPQHLQPPGRSRYSYGGGKMGNQWLWGGNPNCPRAVRVLSGDSSGVTAGATRQVSPPSHSLSPHPPQNMGARTLALIQEGGSGDIWGPPLLHTAHGPGTAHLHAPGDSRLSALSPQTC